MPVAQRSQASAVAVAPPPLARSGAAPAVARLPQGDVMAEIAAAGMSLVHDVEVERGWIRAVAGVNGRKRMLGAFLEESTMLGIAGDMLVLSMDGLHRAVVEEAGNRTLLVEEVSRAFGRPLEVRCTAAVAPPPRPLLDSDVKPMIDRAIAWFDGDVIERESRGERTSE
jgi:hypothetical protein